MHHLRPFHLPPTDDAPKADQLAEQLTDLGRGDEIAPDPEADLDTLQRALAALGAR